VIREKMEKGFQDYTLTMARVYAGQGLWDKAADIYRHLLRWEPGREDLLKALAEAESHAREAARKTPDDLVPLFSRWIDLLSRAERIQGLRRIRERCRSAGRS
jgi:hypothetical protein